MELYSIDAEKIILGTLMVFPAEAIGWGVQRLHPSWFFSNRNQTIANAILDLCLQKVEPDPIMVASELDKKGKLDEAGGRIELNALLEAASIPGSLDHYNAIIEDLKHRRIAHTGGMKVVDLAVNSESVNDIHKELDSIITALSSDNDNKTDLASIINDVSGKMLDEMVNKKFGITTGYYEIDNVLRGLRPSYYIIAGRPGNGKTNLALNMALRQAKKGHRVGFLSIEMSKEEVVGRLLSMQVRRKWYEPPAGMSREKWAEKLKRAYMDLCLLPIELDETPYHNVEEAVRASYNLKMKGDGIDVLYIDYVQLLGASRKTSNKVEELTEVSHALNALKKDLGIPIVALAQLNREIRSRQDHVPILTDLKGTGTLEEDADVVMLVHDPVQWSQTDADYRVYVAKNRNGPLAVDEKAIKLYWDKSSQIVSPLAEPSF